MISSDVLFYSFSNKQDDAKATNQMLFELFICVSIASTYPSLCSHAVWTVGVHSTGKGFFLSFVYSHDSVLILEN